MDQEVAIQGQEAAPQLKSGSVPQVEQEAVSRGWAYRQVLSGAVRLHNLCDPERVVQALDEILRTFLKEPRGLVGLLPVSGGKGETDWLAFPKGIASTERPDAFLERAVQKVAEAGEPILPGDHSFVVPLGGARGNIGGLVVRVSEQGERIDTTAMDLLLLLGRHTGVALENAIQTRELVSIGVLGEEERLVPGMSLRDARRFFERRLLNARLNEANGNIARAARSLEMDRGQLSRMLKRFGIDRQQFKHQI